MAGKYVEFDTQANGNLHVTLFPEAREDVQEISSSQHLTSDNKLAEVIEWHIGNGWTLVEPGDVGALTDAPILSEDINYDDHGNVQHVGVVYWYPEYEVKDPVAQLLENGFVDFTRYE